jgi:hypothetical protein
VLGPLASGGVPAVNRIGRLRTGKV